MARAKEKLETIFVKNLGLLTPELKDLLAPNSLKLSIP